MSDSPIECPPEMLLVPAGPFRFGNDLTLHHLDSFFCDRDPVTCRDYERFIRETRRPPPEWPRGLSPAQRADLPMVRVTFADAEAFAAWCGKSLPTEDQWEKAARGADGRKYPWGSRLETLRTNVRESARGAIVPVTDMHDESPLGIRGCSGNVYQWTRSIFNPSRGTRVLKGGSFRDFLGSLAWRYELAADRATEAVGFRCVQAMAR